MKNVKIWKAENQRETGVDSFNKYFDPLKDYSKIYLYACLKALKIYYKIYPVPFV